MKVTLSYHCVPHLTTEVGQSELAVNRFMRTYVKNPPGYPHRLVINQWDLPGKDIAAHQRIAADLVGHTDVCVFMSSHVFFHRAGWLNRLVAAMEPYDDIENVVYGIMGSKEASPNYPELLPSPHIRTCLFACQPKVLAMAPEINTPADGFFFESQWLNNHPSIRCKMVTWSETLGLYDCRNPPNGFRSGDQSDLLAHDRHSLAYDMASPEQKAILTKIANGESI